jgi:Domain of unknown function (DUF1287)
VPPESGVCSDVVVRAYRRPGIDLQRLVNDDMRRPFAAYPQLWGLNHPDPNIDHRPVANLATFFTRRGGKLPISSDARDYRPGGIVTWRLTPGNPAHIGIVADRMVEGRPLIVHNIGAGAQGALRLPHHRALPIPPGDTGEAIRPNAEDAEDAQRTPRNFHHVLRVTSATSALKCLATRAARERCRSSWAAPRGRPFPGVSAAATDGRRGRASPTSARRAAA